ncbi:golgi-to-ER vesicle coat component [Suhomyces tanzawaensis NRRL Y-17324]|uniref:Coatomer subunit zeta n=1 Tax=Suhomyces tanzawaensis NRRL Y-17324 TaxID=984487 RepID=A0A1E4SK73_9ASCO|nr:golgi-to-ER vesicle coat component [Suhomyces tanzawaensis NRRL Y-17324]ODV79915.1 golgi-to-ER vesicle coat component [Suhomyces tanzawaensis NRRL Y-17324]
MSLNTSLYTISAVLILDNEGSRLYANYYQNKPQAHQKDTTHVINSEFQTTAQQLKFEKSVFPKINKVHQDIVLYDNHLITYKQTNDVILIVVSKINENESLIYSVVANLFESLNILLSNTVDKSTILSKYDLVTLAVDETVDDGVLIEIDPAIIVSRVTKAPEANVKIEVNSNTLFNAFKIAQRIGDKLQQGL